jgi:hypothetical protein
MVGPGYLIYDDVFGNQAQVVAGGSHVWHDNLWFNYTSSGDGVSHGNQMECNVDAPSSDNIGHTMPDVPFNAFYNNVLGHNATGTGGRVPLC